MAKVIRRRGRSQRYGTAEFRPYVIALGQVALAWNDLLESLSALFWTLSNPPWQPGEKVNYSPLHVWHSQRSDRAQIQMLIAVIKHSATEWKRPTNDLLWLTERANNLADARNDAIHSPLFATSKSVYGLNRSEKIAPADWHFNPRAKSLAERTSVLDEFVYCRDRCILLSEYALAADTALIRSALPWPKRPVLPARPLKRKLNT